MELSTASPKRTVYRSKLSTLRRQKVRQSMEKASYFRNERQRNERQRNERQRNERQRNDGSSLTESGLS